MSTVGLESIDHTVQLTHSWINELDALVGWGSKARSYRLLRTVLQALRDWLPVNDAAHFGAQLPTLLRGVYYEHWRPADTPVTERHRSNFLARVDDAFRTDPIMFTRCGICRFRSSWRQDRCRRDREGAPCIAGGHPSTMAGSRNRLRPRWRSPDLRDAIAGRGPPEMPSPGRRMATPSGSSP